MDDPDSKPKADVDRTSEIARRVREHIARYEQALATYMTVDPSDESAFANANERLRTVHGMLHTALLAYFDASERRRRGRP